jgi:hypothetical protein
LDIGLLLVESRLREKTIPHEARFFKQLTVSGVLSLETISRSVQRLAQALKTERALQGQGIRNLEEALARVLDELGSELGGEGQT